MDARRALSSRNSRAETGQHQSKAMTSTSTDVKLSDRPPEGKITQEALDAAQALVGTYLRPEGPYIRDVTLDTIKNYCNGIGDLNPLYRDTEYGRESAHGSLIAHPTLPMIYGYIGRTRWGFPGVHGFFAGNDWEFFKAWRPGDRINCFERVVGVVEKDSRFSGKLVLQYTEGLFLNQNEEVMARTLGWCTRHERRAARASGKHSDMRETEYTAEQIAQIETLELREPSEIRGRNVRYWQDVLVGEELPPIARGPLTTTDLKGFHVGVGRGHTHGLVLLNAQRHPDHYFRSKDAGGGVEYTGIGHQRTSSAQQVGAPAAYDYGPARTAWLATLVSNWMGDAAFLKRVRGEMRRFNLVGDTTWCKGRVIRKYEKDGYALIDLDIWAENQRGEITAPGLATVMLPSKDIKHRVVVNGAGLDLALPTIR
jgi:acyl dehydratase